MIIHKTMKIVHVAILLLAGSLTAAAQGYSVPSGRITNFVDWNESFEGSTGSSGQEMVLNSSAAYHFGRYSVGTGIPVYFNRSIFTNGATMSAGIGDVFVALGASWNVPLFNYNEAVTATVPTGDPNKGFSTGHVTFDWNNRIDQSFGFLTPFVDGGIANTITDTPFFHRPFTSYGYLAHFEAGADVNLPHSLNWLLSAYEIAPWGTQTIISRDVVTGATGSGGQNGRVYEVNHLTTGPAFINHDEGFTAGLTFSPKPYLSLSVGYTRSLAFAFDSFSWRLGLNMSRLISGPKPYR